MAMTNLPRHSKEFRDVSFENEDGAKIRSEETEIGIVPLNIEYVIGIFHARLRRIVLILTTVAIRPIEQNSVA